MAVHLALDHKRIASTERARASQLPGDLCDHCTTFSHDQLPRVPIPPSNLYFSTLTPTNSTLRATSHLHIPSDCLLQFNCVTVARTRRQNALDASTAPLYYYHDRVQHRYTVGRFDLAALCGCRTLNFCLFGYTRPPLRPSRPDLRPHRDSNQRPPTHGPPCRTHGQEFWTLTGLELATCGSVPKTHATSRPLHYCVANLAPNQDVTVARTRRQNALDASTAPLYYYHDRVQHRYTRPPLRPSRPDLRPHRDSNQRPPTHGPPCRTHGQEFWTLTGLELATCGSVPKTHATSRPLHYCVANLAPKPRCNGRKNEASKRA